jgi:predicted ferric reductase
MTAPSRPFRSVPLPRIWSVRAGDVIAILAGNAVLILAMWIRHGGPDELHSTAGLLTGAGQLAALFGTYLVLIELVLIARSPWLDQLFGTDRLLWAHRWIGFGAVWLIGSHFVLTTLGWAMTDQSDPVQEAVTLLTTYPFVLMTGVALALFVVVAIVSVRAARRRLSYETWYGIHLYTYLAIALAFAHQLVVGSDFSQDPVARLYWILLYVSVVALVATFRLGEPLVRSLRHDLRVARVVPEGPGVASIYVSGRDLDQLAVRSGQWFQWRFLGRDLWWRAHPFSLSAAPNGHFLRITVKALGDDSRRLLSLHEGTRVWIEGPYGAMTGAARARRGVLLVAGGIGIAPLRALFEALPGAAGDVTLLYRASRAEDLVFRAELDRLAELRGYRVHYLVGRRGVELATDPLSAASIRRLVPDAGQRDAYICGPVPMMDSVRASLDALGVPGRRIHLEQFAY